ncbi:MAG: ABC transporter permease subunit [Chloroflexi bacterium]|nr:ABC transporter permease subunit [Chloroflexota bacterium]
MNERAIKAIVRKDLKVVARSRGVILPLVLVPTIMLIALPALAALAPAAADLPITPLAGLDSFIANMPPGLQAELAGLDEAQRWVVLALVYFLAPMYLIIPLMVASVIAADSFAGEKERKTLEALLYTPTTDGELFLGKVLSAWLPAVGVAWGGFVLYGLVANLAAWPVMERIFFPTTMWLVLVIWVAPAVAGLGLGTMVLVSVRVQGFQEAYQLGGAVVLPILLLVIGQAMGVMYLNVGFVLLLGLVLWGVDALLLWFGTRTFRRSKLTARI